jgi:predicted AAA+ superfamily ATPase
MQMLTVPPKEGTSYYGELFESFVIIECRKLASYFHFEYKFSYLMTGAGVEVDLIVERPGRPKLLIEIKSCREVNQKNIHALQKIGEEIGDCEVVYFINEPRRRKVGAATIYPWAEAVRYYFGAG